MADTSKIEEEIYTHEYLWRSASRLLGRAEADADGSFYFLLPSLLMTYMAYEAFINFCGFVILPELWREEKKNFKGQGTEDKIARIASELPGFVWKKGEAPYQRVAALEEFRSIVAHGKVVANEYIAERKGDGSHFQFKHAWDDYLSIDSVKRAQKDVKEFCQSILVELRKKSDHLHLNFDVFEGALASGTGVTPHG